MHSQLNRPANKVSLLLGLCLLAFVRQSLALVEPQYVENTYGTGDFCIAQGNGTAPVYVDTNDFAGVLVAASNLRADVNRVTGHTPDLVHAEADLGTNAIIIGTVGKSRIIDELIQAGKIDVSSITNRWESYFTQAVPNPLPGVANALVIVGSDQRGTIYGIYDLSAEMGVSPWYFWADVPVQHQDNIFVKAGKYEQGPPAVKYRGIFINDEAPDLTGWVKEKFGDYNHAFYTNVFELLLRLKANYLWPAMWDNCFNEDDPLNPKLADEYGIVMGTSHVEPMMRADKEWNRLGYTAREWDFLTHSNELIKFWKDGIERNKNHENVITIAMRGKIDTPMSETANISLLEEIVAAQRQIIAEVYHTNAAAVPQDWALYKEVQEYYEKGMRVPEDVTLLWCDDNWGDLRRLPPPEDRARSGGAGVYYHFDYVGGPRNYKWLNTNPTTKIWEQMNLAYHYDARQIWIVNVGHLKGYEPPIEFFLSLAWNPQEWPKEKISEFTRLWAERQFGPEYAPQIADILTKYTKYNGRRKPELLDPNTFSLVDYQEADRVLADWKTITAEAEEIYQKLPENERDAFFELVLYPTKACEQVNDLYITTAKNRLYASQGRPSADDYAAQARALFKADADLSDYYNHVLAGGKWDHMMDQTHIGYTYWQQPNTNVMPQVDELQVPIRGSLGVAVEGSTSTWPSAANEPVLPEFDGFNQPRQYIDVFDRGQVAFPFTATPSAPWIELSATNGMIDKEERLWVGVDWAKAPKGEASGSVTITGARAEPVAVSVNELNPKRPTRNSLKGFVEADGYVSIEAAHYTKKIDAGSVRWEEIPHLGRTLSAMSIFPVTAPSVTPPKNSPRLEYKMYLFHPGKAEVEAIIDPTLNFVQGRGLRYALSFDDQPPKIVTAVPADYTAMDGNHDWETTVRDSVRKVKTTFTLSHTGYHTLKFWMVDPGVVLQKLVVNLGGVKPSYLGPPESFHSALRVAATPSSPGVDNPRHTEVASAQADPWVGTWGTSPQLTEPRNLPPRPGLTSNTLRQIVQVSIGGKKLCVRFSNAFGTNPVTMSSVHLALSAGGSAIQTNSDVALTFQGKPSVTIPAGESVVSDVFDFDLAPLSDVAVTIHFDGTSAAVTSHPGSRSTSYLQTGDAVSAADLPAAARMQHWYILTGIDVEAENSSAAIVTLGDSITDGRGSGTDKNDRWPDDLARRLQANKDTADLAVLNEGIGGNCVLRGGLGPTALSRFNRDVLSQSGARWLIVLEGVNDIGGSRNASVATNLIAAYEKIIEQAHAHDLRVYGATILPFGGSFYDSPAHEAARETANDWIRTGGKFDAVIDFDEAMRDPQNPSHLLPAADSGDHLHPNEAGYKIMAGTIDLKLFRE